MSSFLSRITGNFLKLLTTLAGLAIVFYVLIRFRLWSMDWTEYFIRVGGWEEIIFISLVVAAISAAALWLFKLHLRRQTGGR